MEDPQVAINNNLIVHNLMGRVKAHMDSKVLVVVDMVVVPVVMEVQDNMMVRVMRLRIRQVDYNNL